MGTLCAVVSSSVMGVRYTALYIVTVGLWERRSQASPSNDHSVVILYNNSSKNTQDRSNGLKKCCHLLALALEMRDDEAGYGFYGDIVSTQVIMGVIELRTV